MRPIDIRNENWESIQDLLTEQRGEVLAAWRNLGPGTTREVAIRSGIDLLSFRPRTTELLQLCMIQLAARNGLEGVYQAIPASSARAYFETTRFAILSEEQRRQELASAQFPT